MGLTPLILEAGDTIKIEKGISQLFVDDALIESSEGLVRTLHQPIKDYGGDRPVIAVDKAFGKYPATLEANGTIVFDPGLKKYVMYVLVFAASLGKQEPDGWQRTHLLRYTSKDGLDWMAGDDGEREQVYPRSRMDLYDSESGKYATNIDLTSFYYDVDDKSHPYKGWIWFSNWDDGREGAYFMRSADGKHWERGEQLLVYRTHTFVQNGRAMEGAGDVSTFYPDPGTNRFLALIKFFQSDNDAVTNNLFRSRAYLFVDRMDEPIDLDRIREIDLIPTGNGTDGDEIYDEYYGSSAWRYGSQWLGLLKIWHGKGDYPYSSAGCAYFKLVTSRDGLHWDKVAFNNPNGQPEVFLPNGKEGGNNGQNDGGYMTDFSHSPIRIGDDLVFYYGSSSYGKRSPDDVRVTGGGIFRARLRVDGFVSVDKGSLTTPALKFDGKELFVNSKGTVKIEILDSNGKRLASARAVGDNIRHRVRFKGKSIGSLVNKGDIHFRFTVRDGSELYSFVVEQVVLNFIQTEPK